jgi:hypothetical protein
VTADFAKPDRKNGANASKESHRILGTPEL